jgi:putative hydrolase of the HAD superfamily
MPTSDAAIRAVIFDFGGVLTRPGRVAIEEFTRAERIRPDTFSAALKAWLSRSAPDGTPLHQLERGELGVADFERALAERLRTEDDGPVAPEGLLDRLFARWGTEPRMWQLVREVRAAGFRTALLSNSWGNRYPREQLAELFELSVISSEVGLRKPEPAIYRLVLDRLDLPPEQTLLIDDGKPNIEAAEQLGMRTVLHNGENGGSERTRAQVAELLPLPDEPSPEHAQESR